MKSKTKRIDKTIKILLFTFGLMLMLCSSHLKAQNYVLVWSDEFTDGMSSDWTYDIGGHGWGNNEQQYYTNSNTSVADGILKITVKKENYGGRKYTSSRIKTKGAKAWKYGRFEARIKLTKVQGNFPAFWLLGASFNGTNWPQCGEIDIMEQINLEDILHSNVHYDYNGHKSNNKSISNTVSEFHVYRIDWDSSAIRFFLDDKQYHQVNILNGVNGTEEFHKEHFILLNYAMGGNWPGLNIDDSALPVSMEVDYVRVYQKDKSTSSTILEKSNQEGILCYPNPVNEILNLELENSDYSVVEIYSVTGSKVFAQEFSGEKNLKLNVNHLDAGMYKVVCKNHDFNVQKMIVKQ